MGKYAKSIVAAVSAAGTFVLSALADGEISGAEWLGLLGILVTGGATWGIRNRPTAPAVSPAPTTIRDELP